MRGAPHAILFRLLVLVLAFGAGACISWRPLKRENVSMEWVRTLDNATLTASNGRFGEADSLLTGFAARHPNTAQAHEAQYWLAVFRLDPSNQTSSIEGGIAALDRYLAADSTLPKRREALTMRRLAAQLATTMRLAAANASVPTSAARPAPPDDRQGEIQRLRAELAKANEELDRIRKRLATPKP